MLFGMVEAMCWIGFAAGPLLTSLAVALLSPGKEIVGVQQTFYVSAGCQLFGVLLLIIFKRESLRNKRPISAVRLHIHPTYTFPRTYIPTHRHTYTRVLAATAHERF